MNCNQDFYGQRAALEDFKPLEKEIKNHIKKHSKDCSRVSPLTRPAIETRNKLLCTINEYPNAMSFSRVKSALNYSMVSYYSLEECQDSVSKLPEANESNATTEIKDGGSTEMSMDNDNESTTKSKIEVVTDLKPTENSVSIVSNPNGEVATTPNSTNPEATINNSTLYNEDPNSDTDDPKNGEKTTTPQPQNITEATGNSTKDEIKDGGSTEMSMVNDNESTTKSEIEVVTDLKPTENPVSIVSNPKGEVATTPNSTKSKATINNSTLYYEDPNSGTDRLPVWVWIVIALVVVLICGAIVALIIWKLKSKGEEKSKEVTESVPLKSQEAKKVDSEAQKSQEIPNDVRESDSESNV